MPTLDTRDRWVAIEGDRITAVGDGDPPSGAIDLGDAILAPGLIDIQINGIGDVDFSRLQDGGYERARERLSTHGVTTFVPTLISAPLDAMAHSLDALAAQGAEMVHLEGPFLGGAPGAHNPAYLIETDVDWTLAQLDRHPGLIRIVTIAPEADPSLRLTRALSERDVIVSIGHSTSSYGEARSASERGARAVTHLFNAMSGLHHREPGVVGAALEDDTLTPSLIADLVHVHPAALNAAIERKRNIALISDAIGIDTTWAAARGVKEIDGAPRLPDGTLAGSVLTLDRAISNVVEHGVPVERAIEMASTIPAELLGLSDRGALLPGRRADIVALDRRTLAVRSVWKDGVPI